MKALQVISLMLFCFWMEAVSSAESSEFVAAVYEHAVTGAADRKVILPKQEALKVVMANMDIYELQIQRAKQQNASIIVFPEYGLTSIRYTRDSFQPFLEDIPDPKKTDFTACQDPKTNLSAPIMHRLSCLARDYNMYIVANMGDIKNCSKNTDQYCPKDGRYQYNTNVVFDNTGKLVARYHKQHPFRGELKLVDRPRVPEYITFNTPFGKFGTMICFDVLFHDPAIPLVTEHKIDHVVFPTAWFDSLPLLSAIGFHGSWARGMEVNFLGANTHLPKLRSTGSGIYTPTGVKVYYRSKSNKGSLSIAVLPKNPKKTPREIPGINKEKIQEQSNEDVFYSQLTRHHSFRFKELKKSEDSLSVCFNGTDVCCSLDYKMSSKRPDEMFALGVFSGFHRFYYEQICALIKCETLNRSSCGQQVYNAKTIFDSFTLKSQLDTKYVFPQVVADGVTLLPGEWHHNMPVTHLKTKQRLSKGLVTAAMFGRVYERDVDEDATEPVPPVSGQHASSVGFGLGCLMVVLITCLIE